MKSRKRNRMLGYDYSQDNLYFVTNCVKGMVCCLGEIIPVARTGRDLSVRDMSEHAQNINKNNPSNPHKIMALNPYGEIVRDRLLWLAIQYPYVVLHNFVVMPNHVHVLLEIDRLRVQDKVIKIKSLSSLFGAF
ncbi:hypothetical protein [Gelidibacter maritimus]|uniref:hypothetical protein n=1 Tax=Gelidibacter maritimus TaxID=2761487 RepID=UPI001F3D8E86|nr:hypothetical protein [Gelidibacter maritimus]